MRQSLILVLMAILLIFSDGYASEVDQFTHRFTPLQDASLVVNAKANEFLKLAIAHANKRPGCGERRLYHSMRKYFRNHIQGELTPFVINSDQVDKRVIAINQSIYKYFGAWLSPVMGGASHFLKDTSGVVINMGGIQIGSDKFEHFFGRGFAYFTRKLKGRRVEEILDYGDRLERYTLGALTTAVYSYGDLVANFNGLRFWIHVLQRQDDPLGRDFNLGPYIICQDQHWVQVKKINFLDYIDAAWDEGNNCSDYKNQKAVDLVNKSLLELSQKEQQHYQCPMQPVEMEKLYYKYGVFAKWLLNTKSKAVF